MTRAAVTISAADVRAFSARVLEALGMSVEDATIVGDALAWADLRGITPQGIAKLPLLVRRLRAGGARVDAAIRVVADRGAFTRLDAQQATGHVAGVRAMRVAVAKAKTRGIGLAVIGNTDSGSAMGYYASLAAAEGLGGLARTDHTARGLVNQAPPARAWSLALTVQERLGREVIGGLGGLLVGRGHGQRRERVRSRGRWDRSPRGTWWVGRLGAVRPDRGPGATGPSRLVAVGALDAIWARACRCRCRS